MATADIDILVLVEILVDVDLKSKPKMSLNYIFLSRFSTAYTNVLLVTLALDE